jgi:protein-L-isoaspartate(D-aspartate) O-methyltransferase
MNEDQARLMRFVLEMRQEGVTHARALSAMERTPRSHYAPRHLAPMALDDTDLPIAHGQFMTRPSLVGRMIAALDPQDEDSVLEIGTGSGYQAGVLAKLARRVVTLDRWNALIAIARAHLGTARLMQVYAHVADGAEGWANDAPYDRIVVNAAVESIPEALTAQLKPEGVLVAPVGGADKQILTRWRGGETQALGAVKFAPLVQGLPDAPRVAPPDDSAPQDAP